MAVMRRSGSEGSDERGSCCGEFSPVSLRRPPLRCLSTVWLDKELQLGSPGSGEIRNQGERGGALSSARKFRPAI